MRTDRTPSIDQFRGFAILAMVLANFMGGVAIIPAWLKHAPDIGLTVIDLIAPFFIFAIGLTYGISFRRRWEWDGAFKTYSHFMTRFLAIAGLGAVISAGETAFGLNVKGVDWGVLQAIGAAGLVTLLVIRFPSAWRLVLGLGLLAIYQVLLDRSMLAQVLGSPHGGLFGSLSWAAMLILSTVLADLFHDERRQKWFAPAGLLVLLAGIALAFLSPISKNRVSASYVLVSLGISALVFLAFHWAAAHFCWRGRFLSAWGKNPLVLYSLHYLLIGLVFLPDIPSIYAAAPPWLVLLEIVIMIGAISAVAFWFDRRNIVISL